MRNSAIRDLADCTSFRQTIQTRPPAIVHGTATLLVLLVASAVVWSALTEANLVVRAPGRVRPVSPPVQVFLPESGERPGYSVGSRVEEVFYREGETVRTNQPLLRLSTRLLDDEIARRQLALAATKQRLQQERERAELETQRFHAARAKAEAELAEVDEELRRANEQRRLELDQAAEEHRHAQLHAARIRSLSERRVVTQADLEEAELKLRQAEAKLELARRPIDESKLASRQRHLELLRAEYALSHKNAVNEQAKLSAEQERTRTELAALQRDRQSAVLRSPIDGTVVTREVKPGDVLGRDKPVVQIAQSQGFYFEAAVPASEVGHIRSGMPARIKLDAYDYQRYGTLSGTVVFVSPDSRAVDGPQGKILTYEVRIELEQHEVARGDARGAVQLGLTGPAEIVTDRQSLLSVLLRRIQRTISLG